MKEKTIISDPLFTNHALVSLAIPIVLDALFAIAAGIIDSAMVSSAGEAAVSAVSLVDSLNAIAILMFNAITTGGVVVTSQYIGKGDISRAKSSANQLLVGSTLIATVFMLFVVAFNPKIISLVYGKIDTEVFENAKTYCFWTALGFPFFAIGSSATSLLRAQAKSSTALFITATINVLNVFGNAILIHGFGLGVAGAAISTTTVRVLWAISGLFILHNKSLIVHFENLHRFRFDFDIMRRVMKIGVANGVENGLFQTGKILVASLVSSLGTIAIAANSVANSLCNIGWTTIGSFGTMLLTVVGQCMGAGKPDQAEIYTKKVINFCHFLALLLFGSIFLFRNQLIGLFSFGEEALTVSTRMTGICAILTILSFYSLSFVPVAAFRAAGDVKYAVILSFSSMFVFRVGLSYFLHYFFDMGLESVFIGMWADWFCRSIFNTIRLRNKKWLTKTVI